MGVGRFVITVIFVFGSSFQLLLAQPELNSKRQIEGVTIFHDKSDPLIYYFQPGNLVLKKTKSGAPEFKFLDMRYTGTKCYGDIGEKEFMSLVKFGVTMKPTPQEVLDRIKKKLTSRKSIRLKPLPITQIHSRVIIPVESNTDKNYEVVDASGSLEAEDKKGYSSSKSYWTHRTYNVKLNKHESQLLKQQLDGNLLGLSLNYSYYSKLWMENEEISGSEELVAAFEKDSVLPQQDNLKSRIVLSNTLSIELDTKKHPETFKQLDINEEIPASYAVIELKCYDFIEDLRPDLYMKVVEVEATTMDNQKTAISETKFFRKQQDIYTKHIQFPYAIQMNAPMRYRITEIAINGKKTISNWKDKPECSSVIDVTSTSKEQKFISDIVDVEIDKHVFNNEILSEVKCYLLYTINNQLKTKELVFSKNDEIFIKSIPYKKDKNSQIYYLIKKYDENGEILLENEKELLDNYLYIN